MHGRKSKQVTRERPRDAAPSALRKIFYCILLLVFVLIAFASYLPDSRLWGINHLAYYPVRIRIVMLVLMGVSFLPVVARTVHSLVAGALDRLRSGPTFAKWIVIVVAVLSVAVFVRYRSSTLLLGDGQLVVRNYEYVSEGYTNVVTRDIKTIISDEDIARGASVLYFLSVQISEKIFGGTPLGGIRTFNCILGGIFVLLFLGVALRAELATETRIWMIFLVLSSGTMQLFFGYAENYTPLIFFCFLYLVSAFAFIHRARAHLLLVSLLLLLASIFIHIQAVLLAPSFLLLVARYAAGTRRRSVERYATPALAALPIVGIFVARAVTDYARYMLPVKSGGEFHGILSLTHWSDIANELLILLPVFPLFVVMAFALARRDRKRQSSKRDDATGHSRASTASVKSSGNGWFTLDAEWYFSILIFVPTLLYLAVFKAEIGMPRDWDLFTIVSIGMIPLALLVLNRALGVLRARALPLLTVPALVMSSLVGIAWIGINADVARSAERFERILLYDRTNEAYVYEILARHYYREDQLDRAIPAVRAALSLSHNPRHYVMLARFTMADGRTEDAIETLETLLVKKPDSEYAEWARGTLVTLLDETKQYEKLLSIARDGTRYHPDEPIYHYFYGKMLLAQGKFQEGVEELLECKRLNPPPPVLQEIDTVIEQLESEGKI